MNQDTLIAYALSFTSFLRERLPTIEKVILFGSVARGSFDQESDIDLFIDTRQNVEQEVQKILALFRKSELQRKWELKGVKQTISVTVGSLKEWQLRRDVLSDGIVLYGKYKEVPEKVEYYLLIQPSFADFEKVKKVRLWRTLHGYSQKVNNRVYRTKGLLEEVGGKKIEHGFLVPMSWKERILDFLRQEKVAHTVHEIWSDTM